MLILDHAVLNDVSELCVWLSSIRPFSKVLGLVEYYLSKSQRTGCAYKELNPMELSWLDVGQACDELGLGHLTNLIPSRP